MDRNHRISSMQRLAHRLRGLRLPSTRLAPLSRFGRFSCVSDGDGGCFLAYRGGLRADSEDGEGEGGKRAR